MKRQNERRSFFKYLLSLSAFITGSVFSFNRGKDLRIRGINSTKAYGMGSAGHRVKKIGIEEHCHTEQYLAWLNSKTDHRSGISGEKEEKVNDLGEGRIKVMDDCGLDMQVLSLSLAPGLDIFDTADAIAMAKIVNNELSAVTKRYPERFASFAAIPMQDPVAAADELERAVKSLGLKGAMIDGNREGQNLSEEKYEVLFERLANLDVPLYLHARGPGPGVQSFQAFFEVESMMNGGRFDKYPGLKIMLGHGGEGYPFFLWRLDNRWKKNKRSKLSPSEYFKKNIYVTTSGQCWPALLQFLIEAVGSDRILFATDYPFEDLKQAVDFIDSAPISDIDREKICHLNAEKLFKL